MTLRLLAVLTAGLLAAGCAALPVELGSGAGPARGTAAACVPLFEEFDRLQQWHAAGPNPDSDRVEVPALQRQGQRLIRVDCITRSRHLARMEDAPVVPVVESGAAITRTSLHAGAVAGLVEEFRVRAHFGQQGVRVRSVGHESLGRRIYLGPFTTEGGLRSAAEAARAAGFVAPYPARF